MNCPICGDVTGQQKPAPHLPRFVRCPQCGGYVTEEKAVAAYPKEYFVEEQEKPKKSVFSPMLDFFLWLRMRKIRGALTSQPPLSSPPWKGGEIRPYILDYGCGNGKLVAYLSKKGFAVDGYDPEPSAVALAQARGLPVFGEIPKKQYAVVMFWHSLEHSAMPLQDVRALADRLAPRARLLIAVPNGDGLEAHLFGESFFCYDWPFHRVHFTPRSLATLLEKAGFRILSVDHCTPEYTVSSLAQTFLNLFLPKNALYSVISARRQTAGKGKLFLLTLVSLLLLVVFSPALILFFVVALLSRRTSAFITVAERAA